MFHTHPSRAQAPLTIHMSLKLMNCGPKTARQPGTLIAPLEAWQAKTLAGTIHEGFRLGSTGPTPGRRRDLAGLRQSRLGHSDPGQSRMLGTKRHGTLAARAAAPRSPADRLVSRNQVLLAIADEVGAAHPLQRFAQQRPIFRVVV